MSQLKGCDSGTSEVSPGQDVSQRILRAAVHLFASKGFAATTTREIVEAAGVTKPMLYYYFGSKEGVCRAALTSYVDEAKCGLERILQEQSDPRAQMVEFIWFAFRFHEDNPDFFRMAMVMFYGPKGEVPGIDIPGPAREIRACVHRIAENACRSGIARPGCEEALGRALDGMIAAWTRSPLYGTDAPLTRELAEQVVDDLLRGFGRA